MGLSAIRMSIVGWVTAFILYATQAAFGQYLFLSGDARVAATKLIVDMQRDAVDLESVAPAGQTTLQKLSGGTMTFPAVASLGPLVSVCPSLIVGFPNGGQFAFRSLHARGSLDWVVTVSRTPELVQNLVYFQSKGSGPPAILPPVFDIGKEVLPPVEIDCQSPTTKKASNDELKLACSKWPDMCKAPQ